MIRCRRCYMPDTRPGSIFEDGVCGACLNYDRRKDIPWKQREADLNRILDAQRGAKPYDVVVPVSGGKDSHRLVQEMVARGMTPLLVTVTDSFTHTTAGTANLRNLITRFNLNHWQYTISHDLFIRATRHAFEKTGEALKFVEYAIYTVPFMLAQKLGIGLVVFGENSAYEYGSTRENFYMANAGINAMTDVLDDADWWEPAVSAEELRSIRPARSDNPLVIFMSYFLPWSSLTNLKCAEALGFKSLKGEWERKGTIENFEQIDSVAYMVHLWLKYPKFGFQRVSDIAGRRVREGKMTLGQAMEAIHANDHLIDPKALEDFCSTCGYSVAEFWKIVEDAPWNKFWKGGRA